MFGLGVDNHAATYIMGVCSSTPSIRVEAEVDSGRWNAGYESSARQLTKRHRKQSQKLLLQPTSPSVIIEKKGEAIVLVNDYKVVSKLGKGAFGEVFLATHGQGKYA